MTLFSAMTKYMTKYSTWAKLLPAGVLGLVLCGCEGASIDGPSAQIGAPLGPALTGTLPAKPPGHRLSQGEKIRVAVFNEQQLSGEFEIDGLGNIPMPLVGLVPAAGRTSAELEADIIRLLKGRYLVDPKVSIEVTSALPIYVIGEVKSVGPIAYKPGLTVVSAVALAGGYTARANSRYVEVRRAGAGKKETVDMVSNAPIFPGDVIEVPERYF